MFSCSRDVQVSQPKIPEDRFVSYEASLFILTQEEKLLGHDSLTLLHKTDSLQKSYHFSRGDVDQTMEFYHGHLDRWRDMLNKVGQNIEHAQRASKGR